MHTLITCNCGRSMLRNPQQFHPLVWGHLAQEGLNLLRSVKYLLSTPVSFNEKIRDLSSSLNLYRWSLNFAWPNEAIKVLFVFSRVVISTHRGGEIYKYWHTCERLLMIFKIYRIPWILTTFHLIFLVYLTKFKSDTQLVRYNTTVSDWDSNWNLLLCKEVYYIAKHLPSTKDSVNPTENIVFSRELLFSSLYCY